MKSPISLLLAIFLFTACEETSLTSRSLNSGFDQIIPIPAEITEGEGFFSLSNITTIEIDESSWEIDALQDDLKKMINAQFGISLNGKKKKSNSIIKFQKANNESLGDEGYSITIDENEITLAANSNTGLYYAVQSLTQMMEMNSSDSNVDQIMIPATTIVDHPRFEYRGSMLDVSRHFFPVEDVKDYIDRLARYKMNVMHLHLADDQGWRIHIDSWPKLTEIGGSTEVGGGKGGFFSQADYKEIVDYAASKHITIIPEIDMPGHTNAALASYPELNCDGKATELYTGTKVGFSSFCIGKDITYKFIDDVIKEVAAITPGQYIHIGGDEAHATKDKEFKDFIVKVEAIVEKHGKTMIGWNDIAKTAISENSVAQYWHPFPDVIDMAKVKNPIIMSPAKRAYLDMKYSDSTKLGLKWASLIEVDHGYNWNPVDYLPELNPAQIIGIEAPLWSETVTNQDEVEYLVFPRLLGYAEIGWSLQENRNWEDYKKRLAQQTDYFKKESINFYPSNKVDWSN